MEKYIAIFVLAYDDGIYYEKSYASIEQAKVDLLAYHEWEKERYGNDGASLGEEGMSCTGRSGDTRIIVVQDDPFSEYASELKGVIVRSLDVKAPSSELKLAHVGFEYDYCDGVKTVKTLQEWSIKY